jgi:hypothetical protein
MTKYAVISTKDVPAWATSKSIRDGIVVKDDGKTVALNRWFNTIPTKNQDDAEPIIRAVVQSFMDSMDNWQADEENLMLLAKVIAYRLFWAFIKKEIEL